MKQSSKPNFDNIPLKRWLLKVGPIRRKTLLKKFKNNLVRLGIRNEGVRKGLLQLSSRPFVDILKNSANQVIRNNAQSLEKPKSVQPTVNVKEIEGFKEITKNKELTDKNNNEEFAELDLNVNPKPSGSGANSVTEGSLAKIKSRKIKSSNKLKSKRKRRLIEAENPNNITWRLIKIDMADETPETSVSKYHLKRCAERNIKKRRLLAKLIEIFGDDEENKSDDECNYGTRYKAKENQVMGNVMVLGERRSEDNRKSPTFNSKGKRKRFDNQSRKHKEKKLKSMNSESRKIRESLTDETTQNSILSDNATTQNILESTSDESTQNTIISDNATLQNILESSFEETTQNTIISDNATLQNILESSFEETTQNTIISDNVTHQNTLESVSNETTQNTIISCNVNDRNILDPATNETTQKGILSDDATTRCESRTSISNRDALLEKELKELGLVSESENECADTTELSITSIETLPETRQLSVIFKLDKRGGTVSVITTGTGSMTALESKPEVEMNKEVDHSALDVRTTNLTNNTSEETHVPTVEMKIKTDIPNIDDENSTETVINFENMKVKTEAAVQQSFNIGSTSSPRNSVDFDPSPSSTTGCEPSEIDRSGLTGINDRRLGALDNIYVALLGRRRFKEQQQAVSKLALKQNRCKEVSQAKQQFDSKFIIFNQELSYLSNSIGSWDGVLNLIAQGVENRRPASMAPFTKVEVEAAMRESCLESPSSFRGTKFPESSNKSSNKAVICTIDLTEEDEHKDVVMCCDSSTDPSRSPNQKYEVIDLDKDWDIDEIQRHLPSITEVKTISPQQFESNTYNSNGIKEFHPCLLCSSNSLVACSRCAIAVYCSKNCQELHWVQSHHVECIPSERVIRSGK